METSTQFTETMTQQVFFAQAQNLIDTTPPHILVAVIAHMMENLYRATHDLDNE